MHLPYFQLFFANNYQLFYEKKNQYQLKKLGLEYLQPSLNNHYYYYMKILYNFFLLLSYFFISMIFYSILSSLSVNFTHVYTNKEFTIKKGKSCPFSTNLCLYNEEKKKYIYTFSFKIKCQDESPLYFLLYILNNTIRTFN